MLVPANTSKSQTCQDGECDECFNPYCSCKCHNPYSHKELQHEIA